MSLVRTLVAAARAGAVTAPVAVTTTARVVTDVTTRTTSFPREGDPLIPIQTDCVGEQYHLEQVTETLTRNSEGIFYSWRVDGYYVRLNGEAAARRLPYNQSDHYRVTPDPDTSDRDAARREVMYEIAYETLSPEVRALLVGHEVLLAQECERGDGLSVGRPTLTSQQGSPGVTDSRAFARPTRPPVVSADCYIEPRPRDRLNRGIEHP